MLPLLSDSGSPRFCDGLTRRRMLEVGGLGALGLGLPQLLKADTAAPSASSTFGRAKRVIFFFMWGGPAHQDTWDLKPEGPSATRGEFLPIATNVSGMHISEYFSADRAARRQVGHHPLCRARGQQPLHRRPRRADRPTA